MYSKLDEKGFTIVELIVGMTITLVLSGMIISFAFDYWGSSANIQADLETFTTRLDANDKLRELFTNSNGLIIQNSIPDSHTLNPDTSIASGLYWTPLHAIPGLYSVGASGTTTPILYFRRPSVNKTKNIVMNGTQPYDDEYVLYLNGTTQQMLLRTLANSSATNNSATTSCPPQSASSTCPTDKVIADNLTSVNLRYFSRSGNLMDWTSIFDTNTNTYAGPDFPAVEAIELNLHISKKAAFHGVNDSTNQTVIRIALLNT